MKNKKLYIIVTLIVLSLIFAIQPNTYAAETKTLRAQKLREGIGGVTPYAYQLQQKDVWKIYEAENDYSQAIYCLEAGIGNLWSGNTTGVVYDTPINMKQSTNSLQTEMLISLGSNPTEKLSQDEGYKAEELLKATTNNGSILWLLDNFYLPKHPDATERQEMRNALLAEAFKADIAAGTIRLEDIKLTDDDIEVVQQWALWQFTTQNNYDANYTSAVLPEMYIATGTNDSTLSEYSPLSDFGRLVEETDPTYMIGEYRQSDAQILFDYLVETARLKTNYTGTESEITLKFAEIAGQFNKTKVGPFKLTATNQEELYNLKLTFKDQNNNSIATTSYTVEDAAGETLTADMTIIDKEFYVVLNDPEGTITAVTAEVSASYVTTTATKWINTTSDEDEQDVVIIEKTPKDITDSKTIEKDIAPFDLHLRKFITEINGEEVTTRIPIVDVTPLKQGTSTDAIYNHPKTPVPVKTGDIVTYTIRVYNEGQTDGYVELVMDDIPEGLEFLRDDEINKEYRWIFEAGTSLKKVSTDYLSKVQEDSQGENLIKGFDPQTGEQLDYRDLKIVFKVIAQNSERTIITNTAEITDDADKNGEEIEDRDSEPANAVIGNKTTYEDDTDEEHLILQHFDLSLTKHIIAVNDLNIIGRDPIPVINEDGTIEFDETGKEKPVKVQQGDVVIYAIRVYNEGSVDGYAEVVMDDIPEGLEFIEDHEINIKYGWYGATGFNPQGGGIEAYYTEYLSKENEENPGDNLIKAFAPETMEEPDYKEILIAFKVLPSTEKGKTIINTAEIREDADADGNEVEDIDSTPGNLKEEEDDIDTEEIYVQYFDLSLLKWVSRVIITDNGETKTIETGHNGSENPEPPAKVDINRWRIKKIDVRFVFEIKVTNEGEIAGYAKEIKDYVPEGLEFVQEDNPKWTIEGDVVTTTQLADTLLKPGESAVISITLRWINDENNMGEIVNSAEISEDYNDSGTEDIDSTPNNNIPEEDDQDPAPVLISIVTGNMTIHYTLIAVSLTILGIGLILIKKYVI